MFGKLFFLVWLVILPLHARALAPGMEIAQNKKSPSFNAYDPFADYSEFESTDAEKDDIYFFQQGRLLTLGVKGGWRFFTFNMMRLYRTGSVSGGPLYGVYLNYFFNIEFSIQFEISLNNNDTVLQTGEGSFYGGTDFTSMGVEFKYYVNRRLFSERFNWFQPFFALGGFYSSLAMAADLTGQPGIYSDSGFGARASFGIEFLFFKEMHFGIQYSFHYVTFPKEAQPLIFEAPGVEGGVRADSSFRPYGDWMNVHALLGINF